MKTELIPIMVLSNNSRRRKRPRRKPGSASSFNQQQAANGFSSLPAYTPVSFHISGSTLQEQLQELLQKVNSFIFGK